MLNLSVFDVDIDLGFATNAADRVRLTFRRPPDVDVRNTILKLKADYGWKIDEGDREDPIQYKIIGDFSINCIGAVSDEVGNKLGELLAEEHGLKVRFCQFVRITPGRSKWTQGVDKLSLL
ncbi:hypothetical protein ACQ4M3_35315 [Leptolyngbya sp. AN03gr2]|uniref:hypothetical protein n=1 Tax=unclassified Leptolyngbya TaxID=2650499 RepID=UPI003D32299D